MRNSMGLQRNILFGVLVLAGLCFYPGLSGGFIFDDAGSLMQLGYTGIIDSWAELGRYVFGGVTGPGGRPIALLSFAMNARTWPANPFPFLLTNIVIHLVNGVLIFVFLQKLFASKVLGADRVTTFLPVIATAIWLLHPIQLSSVLYIVQRMTSLAATFAIATFIVYLEFRNSLLLAAYRRCLYLSVLGVLLFLLGFFTKEIALLLPVQVLIIEIFCGVTKQDATQPPIKSLRKYLVYPAASVFLAYPVWLLLVNGYHCWMQGAEPDMGRPFTLLQRLMTEGRILGDYICAILMPRSQTAGVFNDGYLISTTLFSPLGTLYWWLLHAALIAMAIRVRVRFPVIFLGVLWFYINHILESSVFMLELKFEHRNYLAVLGWALLIGYGFLSLEMSRVWRWSTAVGGIGLLGGLLFVGAKLWGDPAKSSLVWVENNPNSPRALDHAASIFIDIPGSSPLALNLIKRAAALTPNDPTFEIKYLWYSCSNHPAGSVDWEKIAQRLASAPLNWSLHATLRNFLNTAAEGRCPALNLAGYLKMLATVQNNPAFSKTSVPQRMEEEKVVAPFLLGQPQLGLATYMSQDFSKIRLDVAAQQTLVVASHGYRQEAATYFEKSLAIQRHDPELSAFSLSQFDEILQRIKDDLVKNPNNEGG